MKKEHLNSSACQWHYLNDVYSEIEEDIERTRNKNLDLQERVEFYKKVLKNIPGLYLIINLPKKKISWMNQEFQTLLSESKLEIQYLIEQISLFYNSSDDLNKKKNKIQADLSYSNNGLFKILTLNNELISYYFKGHTIQFVNHKEPEEILIIAFNLSDKIIIDQHLEELEAENKRLKNRIVINTLTNREKEIIKLISSGLSSKKISDELGLSVHTVETHRKNILRKAKLNNTPELIRFAIETKLV